MTPLWCSVKLVYIGVMEREDIRLTLRLPAEVHEELVRLAEVEDRSLNAQIVRLLRQSVGSDRPDEEAPEKP